jgi:hypothetical protein
MSTTENQPVGTMSDLNLLGDTFGFTLYDADATEIVHFTFADEAAARLAHQKMAGVIARAVSIVPPAGSSEKPKPSWPMGRPHPRRSTRER